MVLPLNESKFFPIAFDKIGMRVNLVLLRILKLIKPIDIELPDKGGHIVMFVILGKHLLGETVRLHNGECLGSNPFDTTFALRVLS